MKLSRDLLSIISGITSGVAGALIAGRAASRRYRQERKDQRLPAVRKYAQLLEQVYESEVTRTRSEPSAEVWQERTQAFEQFEHDLPAFIRRAIEAMRRSDDSFDYADSAGFVSRHLLVYVDSQSRTAMVGAIRLRLHATKHRLRRSTRRFKRRMAARSRKVRGWFKRSG